MDRRGRYLYLRLRRVQRRIEAQLAASLKRFFAHQAGRVLTHYRAGARELVVLLPSSEAARLFAAMEPSLRAALVTAADVAAAAAGSTPLVDTDPRVLGYLAEAATRCVHMTDQTRRAVREVLLVGAERHYSPWQIAHGVEKDAYRGLRSVVQETYRGRAECIARTEVALASAGAAADRYDQAGVTEVDIIDGKGCGWDGHADKAKADGTRRSLADFRAQPLSHPNCVRIGVPVLESRR